MEPMNAITKVNAGKQVAIVSEFRKQYAALKRKPLRELDEIGKEADDIVKTQKELLERERYVKNYASAQSLERLEKTLQGIKWLFAVDRANQLIAKLDEYYFDEDVDSVELASTLVAELIGSFPNGNPDSPEIYVKTLIAEVVAIEPDYIELETAFRAIRRMQKFLPSVSEVLTEIKKAQSLWGSRFDALNYFEENVERITKRVVELRAAEDERMRILELRNAPLAVGDRVNDKEFRNNFGVGTVTAISDDDFVEIKFDNGRLGVRTTNRVQRILPGEQDYARPGTDSRPQG